MSNQNGMTTIELLITLALIAILTGIALPSFSSWSQQHRLETSVNLFMRSLAVARSEAVKRSTRVALLNETNQWEQGWTVFVDTNADGAHGQTEPILVEQRGMSQSLFAYGNSSAKRIISYRGDGQSVQPNGALLMATIYFCPSSAALPGIKVVIARGGRTRRERLAAGTPKCIK